MKYIFISAAAAYIYEARLFADADLVVVGAPYWDLSFPALLKIYIENIMVLGVTFIYGERGQVIPLGRAGRMFYISTAGGYIGEKEKIYRLADYCPTCRDKVLYTALSDWGDPESRKLSQRLMIKGLGSLRAHLPDQTTDNELKLIALEKILDIYELIFNDGNYNFYHRNYRHYRGKNSKNAFSVGNLLSFNSHQPKYTA